jgi:hypothetical protein
MLAPHFPILTANDKTRSQRNQKPHSPLDIQTPSLHTYMMFHVIQSRQDLRDKGQSDWQIERAIRLGQLERVAKNQFVTPETSDADTWRLNLAVLLRRCGEGAVVSYLSAAKLHRLDGDWGQPLNVFVPAPSGIRGSGVYRTTTLAPEHSTLIDGFMCTTVVRTLVDLGRVVSPNQLELAVESALRGDPKSPHHWNRQLLEALKSFPMNPRIPGHVVLREVLRRRPPDAIPTASGGETLMVQILRLVGLDWVALRQPLVEIVIGGHRRTIYPDFLFWELGLIIEVDGRAFHSSEFDVSRDHRRENAVGAALEVLRFTGSQIAREPEAVASEILSRYKRLKARGLASTVTVERLGEHRFRYSTA